MSGYKTAINVISETFARAAKAKNRRFKKEAFDNLVYRGTEYLEVHPIHEGEEKEE